MRRSRSVLPVGIINTLAGQVEVTIISANAPATV